MTAKRVFIDSNIFLNFLLKEEGAYEGSKRLLTRIEESDMEGITTLINIMEILSVLRKRSNRLLKNSLYVIPEVFIGNPVAVKSICYGFPLSRE